MKRAIPFIPTVVVLAAVVTMIALGIWQLGRADEKEAMLARFEQARAMSAAVDFPTAREEVESSLYRRSSLRCDEVLSQRTTAARSAAGRSGIGQIATCAIGNRPIEIALGWSSRPQVVEWQGGDVAGWVEPAGDGARLVADPPVAGLEPLRRPDPGDLPNNHLAYAGQWFFFALTALVIYALVLRGRMKAARRD